MRLLPNGMLMAAAALLAQRPPSDDDIDAAITNLCRCGTYPRVRTAIKQARGCGLGTWGRSEAEHFFSRA